MSQGRDPRLPAVPGNDAEGSADGDRLPPDGARSGGPRPDGARADGTPSDADPGPAEVPALTTDPPLGAPDPPLGAPDPPADSDERPADLRLARIHLRMGSLELARAELESFAGAGRLDPDALLDLAEVRWRTGDLPGAGVAAQAHLGTGEETLMALVIAAEAAAGAGHPGEAHRLASQAVERLEAAPGPVLERLFAGMPRSGVWPLVPEGSVQPDGLLFATSPTLPAGLPLQPRAASFPGEPAGTPEVAAGAVGAGLWDEADAEEPDGSAPPGEAHTAEPAAGAQGASDGAFELHPEVIHARAALEADDHDAAVAHLTALLQRRPDLAGSVLAALEPAAGPDAGATPARDTGASPEG